MSYYVIGCMVPGYEDYDHYGTMCNAVAGFPDMWPEEKHAEGALYEEFNRMREQLEMMRRYRILHPQTAKEALIEKALVSIAQENGWRVKNSDAVKDYAVSVIYDIPPLREDEIGPMPTRWRDIVRWMDNQLTREEKAAREAKRAKEERERQRRRDDRIEINFGELAKMMEDMLPDNVTVVGGYCGKKRQINRERLQAMVCAELARENGWRQNRQSFDCCHNPLRRIYLTGNLEQ